MFVVAGEALMDVYAGAPTATGLHLDARAGGSPFNVAVGLARLGARVAFLGGISGDAFGHRLEQMLSAEGVDRSLLVRSAAPTTLSIVSVGAGGGPSYAFHGHDAADRLVTPRGLPGLPEEARWLHVGSYSTVVEPVGGTLRGLAGQERTRRLVSYDPNVRLTVEPDVLRWHAVVEEMVALAHLVKVSGEDLQLLYPTQAPRTVAARWLAAGAWLVVVTLGGEGSIAYTARATATAPARPVRLIDTVGAGDTFQAALLAWLGEHGVTDEHALGALDEGALKELLGFASAAASITCSRRGADLPRRAEVLRAI